jgi:protease IV
MFARLLHLFDTLRRALGALFLLAVLAGLVSVWIAARPSVPHGALLVLDPQGEIVEALNTPSTFPPAFASTRQTRLDDLLRVLKAARDDDRISGIVLDVQDMGHASLPALQSLEREIDAFRKSGKKVVAYADYYSQAQYHLAAHADDIWLHPMGMLLLTGLSSYRDYFADALDRLHVKVHLFRAGTYKSAAEPLVRNDMSDAAKEETQTLLGQLWQTYKNDIASARTVPAESIQHMLDDPAAAIAKYNGDPAAMALGMHLIDHIGTRDEMMHALSKIAGAPEEKNGEPPLVEFGQYLRAIGSRPEGSDPKVGVLTASGVLTDDQFSSGGVNGDDFSKLIERTIQDPGIKAVVLRIDSPGGSVQASETIRRALLRLRASGRPIVVCMTGMAASGGYWIAAGADEIWASPSTLTGSIGVFGLFPDVSAGLEAIGIHNDGLGTTSIAGALRPDRPLPQAMADVLQAGVNHVYANFIDIVAKGRHMDRDKVENIAEGRVWSGTDAVRLGLVDHLGGLDQAIAAAAKRAGLGDHYGVRYIRPKEDLREMLVQTFMSETGVLRGLAGLSGGLAGKLEGSAGQWLGMLKSPGGIYAYCGLSPF